MWDSLSDLNAIIQFLHDDYSSITSLTNFTSRVNQYAKRLVERKGKLVSRHWYLHCLSAHIPQLLGKFNSLHPFDCGPQERVNGILTKAFLSVIQTHKSSVQLLSRSLDMVYFEYLNPCDRPWKHHEYPGERKSTKKNEDCWHRVTALDDIFVDCAPRHNEFIFISQ
jgi:hypothetical protein